MIEYVGENLIAGQVGNFLIFLSFVASLLSVAFYYNTSELSLEVNSSPGLEGIEKTTQSDIAGKIIAYIERNVNR